MIANKDGSEQRLFVVAAITGKEKSFLLLLDLFLIVFVDWGDPLVPQDEHGAVVFLVGLNVQTRTALTHQVHDLFAAEGTPCSKNIF